VNQREAVTYFKLAADQGLEFVPLQYGQIPTRGDEVAKNQRQAADSHRKATEQGNLVATVHYAVSVDSGVENRGESYRGEPGFVEAQSNYGVAPLKRGIGVVHNDERGNYYLNLARKQGSNG
jgi:TPR repeat protein